MPTKMNAEDLLLDESFISYCKGSSPEDTAKWELWVKQNPAYREEIEAARKKYYEIFTTLAIADQREQETRLKEKLNINTPAPVVNIYEKKEIIGEKKARNIFSILLKLTAAAMIILVAGYLAINLTRTKKQVTTSFTSANGERKNFQLSDGSVVMLNAGSKITINEQYGTAIRDVYLEGEAFFDVKPNATVPFIVHTETMDVKALGTAFNVKAYPGEKITEASLVRGLVEVTLKKEAGHKVILHPNEKVKCFPANENTSAQKPAKVGTQQNQISTDHLVQALSKNHLGDVKEIAWTENKLEFTDETFVNIAQLIERWYGVKVVFEDESLRQYRFTGIFEKEKVGTVFSILKESRNFKYEIVKGDTLTIKLYQ